MAETIKNYWVSKAGTNYVTEVPAKSVCVMVGAVCNKHATQERGYWVDSIDYLAMVYKCKARPFGDPSQDSYTHPIPDTAIEVSSDGKALQSLNNPSIRYEGRERTLR